MSKALNIGRKYIYLYNSALSRVDTQSHNFASKRRLIQIKDTVASLLATKAVQRIVAILVVLEFSFNTKTHADITVSPKTKTVPSCESLGMLLSRSKK